MKMKLYFFIAFTFAILFNAHAQTNYYVDKATGNDMNNGLSTASAWQTIQKAANAATPNSIVNIKAGTYNENVVVNVSGTAGNPITFRNYFNDIVIIDGATTIGSTMVKITNKNYLNFQNLTIQNKTINDAQGILVETTGTTTSTTLSFKNISIKNINWTNNAATTPTSSDNAQGFIVYGGDGGITNLTVDSLQVSDNILGFSEAVAINGNVDGFVVKNCKVHDNTNIGIDIIGHEGTCSILALDEARNGIVANNECYSNVSSYATSGGIYIDGTKNITVEKNKCYENGFGIEVGAELDGVSQLITVKNNLLFNNEQAGLSIGGYDIGTTGQVINCDVRNNTFFQNNSLNDGTGEISMTKASNCSFENNVFYTNSQNVLMSIDNISPQTGNVFNYNCWYSPNNDPNNITVNWRTNTYSTFATYKAGTSQEANSIYANPNLTAATLPAPDLHLLLSSPCINAGKPTTSISVGETDYDENPRIAASSIDIGAYEYGSSNGIADLYTNSQDFKMYPNPTTGMLSITSLSKIELLQIFDLQGKLVYQNKVDELATKVDMTNYVTGMYFIKMKCNTSESNFKLSKE